MITYYTVDKDADICLANPYSKACCLIFQLYSMEIGSPPLYSVANRVSRDMDLTLLKELGPFLRALFEITKWAENYKKEDDKILQGRSFGGKQGNMAGSFLLLRGV